MNKYSTRRLLWIVTYAILLFTAVQNPAVVVRVLAYVFGLITPFLLGGAIAFVANVPMQKLEAALFGRKAKVTAAERAKEVIDSQVTHSAAAIHEEERRCDAEAETEVEAAQASPPEKPRRRSHKGALSPQLCRAVSLIITLLLVFGVLFIATFLVVPELSKTVRELGTAVPEYVGKLQQQLRQSVVLTDWFPELVRQLSTLELDWQAVNDAFGKLIPDFSPGNVVSSTLGMISSLFHGLLNAFFGFVFALYILLQKEQLGEQAKRLMRAYLRPAVYDKALYVLGLTSGTFSNFIAGQCLEAAILGLMFFLAMTLFGFPYAVMIAVLIAVTALVPVFGAFIGAIVGMIMMLTVSPAKALWFLALFLALQQLEQNFVYPRVVGNSVGLPPIWVLVAVMLGAATFGVLGMLLFIPIMSVLYALLWRDADRRLSAQGGGEDKC
ncbi:MAG TPA: AI-2E family transporter [Terriglobales bacterium]|nr:AI-2E family transporter [Terriglobales bacterium]